MTRSSWYAIALLFLIEFVLSANYTSLHSRTVGTDNGLSLFGVFIESDVWTGLGQTISVEQRAGRVVNIVNWFQNWGQPFQKYVFDNVFNKNKIPLLTWEPWIPERGPNQPDYSQNAIASGRHDQYIANFASSLRSLGRTVYLRPMHEMNGNWYPWAGTFNNNNAGSFIKAWRHIHDIFKRVGASNVKWVWCVNNNDVPYDAKFKLEQYYPGSNYVDILAADGYNWGSNFHDRGGWQSFDGILRNTYNRLTRLGKQDIWITEVASDLHGGNKAQWVRDMFNSIKSMSQLKAIVWFSQNKEADWRIDSPPEVIREFRK